MIDPDRVDVPRTRQSSEKQRQLGRIENELARIQVNHYDKRLFLLKNELHKLTCTALNQLEFLLMSYPDPPEEGR
jgi:hypothetical protein